MSLKLCNFRRAWSLCSESKACEIHLPADETIFLDPSLPFLEIISPSITLYGNNSSLNGAAQLDDSKTEDLNWIVADNLANTNNARQNFMSRSLQVNPGDSVVFSSCGTGVGDTYYRLLHDGQETTNDDYCGLVSELSYYHSKPASTITLQVGCYGDTSCSQTVSMKLSKSSTIYHQLFYYNNRLLTPPSIKVYNLTISGFGGQYGGAILMIGPSYLEIQNSSFFNNFAIYYGGAICSWDRVTTIIRDCIFTNHSAYYGGSIFFHTSKDTITSSKFSQSTSIYGGALYYQYQNKATDFEKFQFMNNAFLDCFSQYGGAIYLALTSSLKFQESTFIRCSAWYGGAVYSTSNQNLIFETLSFIQCSSSFDGGAIYSRGDVGNLLNASRCSSCSASSGGGCIFLKSNGTNIRNSMFENSIANSGGCIRIDTLLGGSLANNSFVSCRAQTGGGITLIEVEGMNLNSVSLRSCSSIKEGGAIFLQESSSLVFYDLTIKSSSASRGGALFAYSSSDILINSSHFSTCSSSEDGGCVFIETCNQLTIQQTSISKCQSSLSGGGIALGSGNSETLLHEVFLMSNSARELGGGMHVKAQNPNVAVIGSVIKDNLAKNGGGLSFYSSNLYPIIMDKHGYRARQTLCSIPYSITQNSVEFDVPGAHNLVLIFDPKTDIGLQDIIEVTFNSVTRRYSLSSLPGRGSPPLVIDSQKATVTYVPSGNKEYKLGFICHGYPVFDSGRGRTIIENNIAKGAGGGLLLGFGNSFGLIMNVDITSNIGEKGGGGVFFNANNNGLFIMQTLIQHNTAVTGSGGAVVISAYISGLVIRNSKVSQNNASVNGGAFFVAYQNGVGGLESDNEIRFQNCTVSRNTAQSGGAFYFEYGNVFIFENLTAFENKASLDDGGVFTIEKLNTISIKSSLISDNVAEARGGAICSVEKNSIMIDSSIFWKNKAGFGGAIFLQNETVLSFVGTISISYNSARYAGGGLGSVRCELWKSLDAKLVLLENSANWGSALFFQACKESNRELQNTTFTSNHARVGGTIYWIKDEEMSHEIPGLRSSSVIFEDNSAFYGSIVATQPVRLDSVSQYSILAYHSPISMNITWYDDYGQLVTSPLNTTSVSISVSQPTQCLGFKEYFDGENAQKPVLFNHNGAAIINSLFLYCAPGGNLTLEFVAKLGSLKLPSQLTSSYDIKKTVSYDFRDCRAGEYRSNKGQCVVCENGTYSFEYTPENSICSKCEGMTGVKSCHGDQLILEPGYWRRQYSSTGIFSCSPPESCIGGSGTGSMLCELGYSGPLCAVCDHGYYSSEGTCVACEGDSIFTPLLVVYILIGIILLGILLVTLFFGKKIFDQLEARQEEISDKVRQSRSSSLQRAPSLKGILEESNDTTEAPPPTYVCLA